MQQNGPRRPLRGLVVRRGISYGFGMGEPQFLDAGIVDAKFGERVKIVRPVNLYGCRLGDDCFVGPFVEIQNDVVVGARTRVQSHAFICELVTIGADCFISHGAMFINDRMSAGKPSFGARETWGQDGAGQSRDCRHERDDPAGDDLRGRDDRRGFGGDIRHLEAGDLCGESGEVFDARRRRIERQCARRGKSTLHWLGHFAIFGVP